MSDVFQMIGASFVLVIGMMIVLWVIYVVQKNAGIVDIGWAFGFTLCIAVYGLLAEGYWLRRWFLTAMVLIWSLRLSWYLLNRFLISSEDSRYQELKKGFGNRNVDFKVLAMFLVQGVLVLLLSLIFLVICQNRAETVSWWEIAGFTIWLIGISGEALADQQLNRFKSNAEQHSQVCQQGLWRYSRHPNYFFETVVWVGYFVFALGSPGGWLMIYCPALMLYLLLKVSGVPLAEAQSLRTKGEAYREYQRKTSKFIPWFPKKT